MPDPIKALIEAAKDMLSLFQAIGDERGPVSCDRFAEIITAAQASRRTGVVGHVDQVSHQLLGLRAKLGLVMPGMI